MFSWVAALCVVVASLGWGEAQKIPASAAGIVALDGRGIRGEQIDGRFSHSPMDIAIANFHDYPDMAILSNFGKVDKFQLIIAAVIKCRVERDLIIREDRSNRLGRPSRYFEEELCREHPQISARPAMNYETHSNVFCWGRSDVFNPRSEPILSLIRYLKVHALKPYRQISSEFLGGVVSRNPNRPETTEERKNYRYDASYRP